jgi:hypothetical protein
LQERVILLILLLICAGQVWTIFRGRVTAAIYYCCVAPLGYFSVWKFGTWGPDRLCGVLLIAAGLLVFPRVRRAPRFDRHPLALFLLFLVSITIVGFFFWPIEAMAGKSAVYGSLRGAIQIVNWIIFIGAAWQIGIALSQPGAFEKARKIIIIVGVLHSGYAFYQMAAYATGLPATGIRRPYQGVGAESEQYAAFAIEGRQIGRVGSLIGEPKGLGAISLVWIAATLSLFMEGKTNARLIGALIISLAALFMTFSTSAWGGFVCMLLIAFWVTRGQFPWRFTGVLPPVFVLIAGMAILNSSGVLPEGIGVAPIIQSRTVERKYLGDMPEIEAMKVLADRPHMIPFGTGLGGMSFYIAENLGGSHIIFFPNTGLLAYVCDMGVIGIALLFIALWGGLRPILTRSTRADATTRSLSFIGAVCLIQSFIFDAGITLFALSFLLAADFRHGSTILPAQVLRLRKRSDCSFSGEQLALVAALWMEFYSPKTAALHRVET